VSHIGKADDNMRENKLPIKWGQLCRRYDSHQFLGVFAKLRKATIGCVMSVSPR